MARSSLRMPAFNVVLFVCQTVSPTSASTLKGASLLEHGCKVNFVSGGSGGHAGCLEDAKLDAEHAGRLEDADLDAEEAERLEDAELDAEEAERLEDAELDAKEAERLEDAELDAEEAG